MTTEILYSWGPGECRLALVREGRLAELVLDRPELLAGAVVLGRVVETAPKLGAVFVDIGGDQPAFLQGKGLTVGSAVLAQVKADAHGEKGATLTTEISLPGRWLVYGPHRGGVVVPRKLGDDKRQRLSDLLAPALMGEEGVVVRPHAATVPEDSLVAELAALRQIWAGIAAAARSARPPQLLWRPPALVRLLADNPGVARVLVDDAALLAPARDCFDGVVDLVRDGTLFAQYEVEDAIQAALDAVVPLACGGRVTIEPTAALTAIDVDSGPAAAAEANTQAVAVIARQLRLRNIAGQIVVDFVSGGGKGALIRLVAALKQAVARDPVATHVIGTTPLGLVELTRERKGPSLAELCQERHSGANADAQALAALRLALTEASHRPGRALCLVVASDVAAALNRRAAAVAEAEQRLGRKLTIRADAGRARADMAVEDLS